eukprot:gene10061-20961_t
MIGLEFDLSLVDDLDDIPLEKALSTRVYAFSLVAGIAVSFPIVLELIADFYSGQRENFQAIFSKWILLVALVIPNVIIILVVYPYKYYQVIPAIYNARLILIIFAFMTFMRNYGAPIWTPRITNSLLISMTIALVIDSFEAHIINFSTTILMVIRTLLLVLSILATFGYSFIWLRHLYNRNPPSPLSIDEYCCNLYLSAFVFCAVSVYFFYSIFSSSSWATTNVNYLVSTSYTELVFTATLTVLNGRTARKALLVERLSDLKLDNDMIDIVEDLRNSTDIAVEILNDLLTYEKLTANILQLDRSIIAVQSFIRTTVRPFELQARSKNIDFKLIFDIITNHDGNANNNHHSHGHFRRRSMEKIIELSKWSQFTLFSSENQGRIHHTVDSNNNTQNMTYLRICVTDTGPGISK